MDIYEELNGWTKVDDGGYNSSYWYASPESPEEINKRFKPEEFSAVPYVPEKDECMLSYVPEGTKSIILDMEHENECLKWDCDMHIKDLARAGLKLRSYSSFADAMSDPLEEFTEEDGEVWEGWNS